MKDVVFSGSVPQIYERFLVPLIFEPYGADIARRLTARRPARVLEVAAGTGVVTRALAAALPDAEVIATDLNQPMLDQAAKVGTPRPVVWRQADAVKLPFTDAAFDAVICQFGVMFFPDRPKCFAEARRVLRPGGAFIFNVWDTLAENDFARIVTEAVAALFPDDPPRFLARTPYAYNDRMAIERDVMAGGWAAPRIEVVPSRSRAPSHRDPAIGFCQGTPLRNEIEARDPSALPRATDAAAEAIAAGFGRGPVDGKMQALVITAE